MELLTFRFYARHFDRLLVLVILGGLALLILSARTGTGGDLINGDAAESFEYARVFATQGRLPAHLIRFPIGTPLIGSMLYVPAVLAARGLAHLGLVSPSERLTAGWALPLQLTYCLPFVALSFVAFCYNARMLEYLGFDEGVGRTSVFFWIIATNVGYYALKDPAMSESATYAMLSFYYYGIVAWIYRPRALDGRPRSWERDAILIGAFLGVAAMVRQQNILHGLSLPLVLAARSESPASERPTGSRSMAIVLLAAVTSAVLFLLPWIPWYLAAGKLVIMSYTEGHFNWLSPHPLKILFVPGYHGLFLFHPAFLCAAIGLVVFLQQHRPLRAAWLVAIGLQVYLLSTWYWLSLGASVGHRGFFTVFPLLLCGFAAVSAGMARRRLERPWLATLYALAAANAVVSLLVLIHVIDPLGHGYPANAGF